MFIFFYPSKQICFICVLHFVAKKRSSFGVLPQRLKFFQFFRCKINLYRLLSKKLLHFVSSACACYYFKGFDRPPYLQLRPWPVLFPITRPSTFNGRHLKENLASVPIASALGQLYFKINFRETMVGAVPSPSLLTITVSI